MVDEDQPQRQPAEQVEPQLALADGGQRDGRRGAGFAAAVCLAAGLAVPAIVDPVT